MTERTLLKQTRVEPDDDSSISITSSHSEEYPPEQEFLVESILAEKKGQNGKKLYLISWADYPVEKSTWEPREHIQDPDILTIWKARKAEEAKGLEQPFDYKSFDTRMLQLEREKQERRRRRKAKRKRLGIPVSPEPESSRQRAEDSDSTEAVESDDTPEDYSGMKKKLKVSQKTKKPWKPSLRDSYESEESDDSGTGTSDDSLIGQLRSSKEKKKAKKQALQALRDKRAAAQSTKESGRQNNPSSEKSSEKSKTIRPPSSSSSEVPLADVAERRQVQSRSESTDTTISRQLASTVKGSPKPPVISVSLGTGTSSTRGRPAGRGSSSVGRGRGATRGGVGPKNVFASRGPAKKRPTLIENSADPLKDPKFYGSMRIRRKAELAARGLADAAPDVSVLGGLYAASNPSTYHALKPARRRAANTASNQQGSDLETSPMDIDGLFVNQISPKGSTGVDPWAPTADVEPPYSAPAHNTQPSRPQYQREQHRFNAICHYWHTRGNCSKGYLCDFKHTDEARLPIAPLPPSHSSHGKPPDVGPSYSSAHDPQSSTPPYRQELHGFNAICHFWHIKGNCSKGDACDFKHTNDDSLPLDPPPPGHECYCKPDIDRHYSPPAQSLQPSRPRYYELDHGFNAICHFWHMKGSCNKGDDCPFKHTDDGGLPYGPPPPFHNCDCRQPGHTSANDSNTQSDDFNPPVDDFHRPLSTPAKRIDPPTDDFYRPLPISAGRTDPPVNDFSHPSSTSAKQDGPPALAPLSQSRPLFNSRDPAICPFWLYGNSCNKGKKCKFLHTDDIRFAIAPQPNHKDETCKYWAEGYCTKTAVQCPYLHGYPDGTPERRESIQQPEPSIPLPIIRDDTVLPTGPRKSVSFAVDEPMVFSNEPESYNPPELMLTGPRGSRYNRVCSFWEQNDCWRGEKCRYWHSYDGSDKQIQQTPTVPSVTATKQAETASIQQAVGQDVSTAGSTRLNSNAHNTQGIHHGHPPRSQTESKSVRFQKPEGELSIKTPVESQYEPEHTGQTLSSHQLQLDGANVSSTVQDRSEVGRPKSKRISSKMSMDSYRRKKVMKDLGDRGKEVTFGKDEKNFVVADFGDLTPTKQHPWGQSLAALTKLHFTKICLAQDFKAQLGSLQYQTLWQGSLGSSATDEEASGTMEKAWEHLRLRSAGFVSLCSDFTVLVYPAIEEWKFIEGSASFSPDMRLRYLVFRTNLDLSSPPVSDIVGNPTDYRKTLVESVHGLNFQSFLRGVKPKHGYHFYLLFPSTANLTAGFITKWLRKCSSQCKIYNSQTEGSWDIFVKDPKVDVGIVLIHESVITSLCELPSLRLSVATKSYSFWYIAEGTAEYPMYGPPEGSSPGQLTATRLLPHGHAFFLTPSFLIAEPERAYHLLNWFRGKLPTTSPGTWKLVCAYNIRQYLLDLAIEKSAERDEVEAEYQGQARKDAIMEERGLGYATCLLRFQMQDAVVKMLSQPGLDHYSDNDSSDIEDEFTSPIVYADKFVDADDEQALVTWFAGWAMCKLDQFRKFTVVGTAPKGEKRAVRKKAVTSRAPAKSDSFKIIERSGSPKASRRIRDHSAITSEVPVPIPNENSSASPVKDSDLDMSIESTSVSDRDAVASEQGAADLVILDGASVFLPPQFDGPGDQRPASASSSRSGIQSDESAPRFVPFSLRPNGTVRPEKAVKSGYNSNEDRERYQHPDQRALGSEVSNNSSHQNILAVNVGVVAQEDTDRMDVDTSVVEEGEPTSGGDVERGEVIIKEIKYEATTTWYERWYKEGKGWEHVYVDSWDKTWKYLGVK